MCRSVTPDDLRLRETVERLPTLPDQEMSPDIARSLLMADAALLGKDQPAEEIASIQQTRLHAMIELGISERCHPNLG